MCDFLGEKIASVLGISTPKYQYAIDEYYRMKREVCVWDGVLALLFSQLVFPGILKNKICILALKWSFRTSISACLQFSFDAWLTLFYPWAFSLQLISLRNRWVLTSALFLLYSAFSSQHCDKVGWTGAEHCKEVAASNTLSNSKTCSTQCQG